MLASDYARLIVTSRLVPQPTVYATLRDLGDRQPAAEDLAQALINRKLLTAWQAKQIAAGRGEFLVLEDRYRLLEKLGEGGMGAVFRAFDVRLERQVVLKIPRPEKLSNPNLLKRFRREALANGRLEHPNIVRAYDVGSEGPLNYIVLELVQGQNLKSLIHRSGPLPPSLAVEFSIQVAEALDFAGRQGVIHRDLKPSNIVVTPERRVKVLDLGLARLLEPEGKKTSFLDSAQGPITGVGGLVGTFDYMAPEQAQDTHLADIRSDIYSLGCTLYEMLCGRPPFVNNSAFETLLLHINETAAPIPGLDPALERILLKTLEKKPTDRYQTPTELLADLRAWLAQSDRKRGALPLQLASGAADRDAGAASTTVALERPIESISEVLNERDIPDWLASLSARSPVPDHELLDDRLNAPTRRSLAAVMALAVVLVMMLAWQYLGRTVLVFDWPTEQRAGVSLHVDGLPVGVPADGPVRVVSSPGAHRIRATRPGYLNQDVSLSLGRGEERVVSWNWEPAPETARQLALAVFEQEVTDARAAKFPDDTALAALRLKLAAFQRQWGTAKESVRAGALLGQLPSPLDRLPAPKPAAVATGSRPTAEAAGLPIVFTLGEDDDRLEHWAAVTCVAFSPDSRLVASGSADLTITIWDAATGKAQRTLTGFASEPRALAFSPDGSALATCDETRVSLWELNTGKEKSSLEGPTHDLKAIAFSPDGQTIAAIEKSGSVTLWMAETGKRRSSPVSDGHLVTSIAFSPAGGSLATADRDGVLRIWDLASGAEKRHWAGHAGSVSDIAFSQDGKVIVSVGDDATARIWEAETGKSLQTLSASGLAATSLALAADGKTLALLHSQKLAFYDAATGKKIGGLSDRWLEATCVAYSPDGQTIVSGSADGVVGLWDATTFRPRLPEIDSSHKIRCMAMGPTGERLAYGLEGGEIRIHSFLPDQPESTFTGSGAPIVALVYSDDGKTLVSTDKGGEINLWNAATGERKRSIPAASVVSISLQPQGGTLAAAGPDSVLRLWKTRGELSETKLEGACGRIFAVAFSPSGKLVATGNDSQTLELWNLEAPSAGSFIFEGHTASVRAVAFSPDGASLASGSDDEIVKTWDVDTAKELQSLRGHSQPVLCVSYNQQGTRLASSACDGTALIWHPREGVLPEQTFQIGPAGGRIEQVDYTPDGRYLATVNGNGTITVLRLSKPPR